MHVKSLEFRHAIDPILNTYRFKIILYAFKLAKLTSFERKKSFESSTENEVSWDNFNTYKLNNF